MITRLQKLKLEKAIIEKLALIPFQAKEMIIKHYQNEIDAIEKYGAYNPEASFDSISDISNILNKEKNE